MANPTLQKIIKLTQAQYDILDAGGTVGDYTGLNDNYLYLIQSDDAPMILLTWSSLKSLRDNNQLVPGQQYRITDYQCTTSTSLTTSAGHQFDIIITADSANKLNEKARACLHAGDTYFTNNKLEAWELWYSLDNDTTRFEWADSTNGKGVIYRMIDEFGNDCPYDFKNILYQKVATFKLFQTSYGPSFYGMYTYSGQTTTISGTTYYHHTAIEKTAGPYNAPNEIWTTTLTYSTSMSVYQINGTTVTSYGATITDIDTTSYQAYTFTRYSEDTTYDMSVSNGTLCYSNVIKTLATSANNHVLNKIYFRISSASGLYKNTFGYDCRKMIFSGTYYYNNQFGDRCYNNTFGNVFTGNILGAGARDNVFGTDCQMNTIGIEYIDNNVGAYFQYNTVGPRNWYNTIGTHVQYNSFGNYIQNVFIGSSIYTDMYVRYCEFDNGLEYLSVLSDDTSATYYNWLQNVHIHSGVQGSSSSNKKTISVPDRNLSYSIDYYANNSQTIILD